MSPIKFGTDGWRAIIAREFTFANCQLVTQGIASYINNNNLKKKGIIVGYDNRFMSADFARECARVLVGNGIKTFLLQKAAPTPVTAYAVTVKDAGGAIMITASHNPPEYNGIKFIPEYAGPAMPDVTEAIEEEINRVLEGGRVYALNLEEAEQLDLFEEIEVDCEYLSHLQKLINREYIQGQKLKVVVDPMFGAGIAYLDRILEELGCEVRTINNYRDVLFGGSMPEPVKHFLPDLKRTVLSYHALVGLALDGDADRFGVIDENGDFVSANVIMPLLLEHLLQTRSFRGPVCRSAATTHMLDRIARKNGLNCIETPVGFKYIGEALRNKTCMLGGEESGGLSIMGHIPEKDGILTCLLIVEMLAYSGKTITQLNEELQAEYGNIVNRRFDIKVEEAEKEKVISKISDYKPRAIAGLRVESHRQMDGSKFIMEDGSWVLIRPSGTEPLFRLYVETADLNILEEIRAEVVGSLGL
ncbi:MAG: phosphoglucomutase/phosphomannomutase family protein [Syntrophomonadaceae bacterium]|nr:phosphoglucomutase/phosphomannomutase family protein [Syntrophomonadaceae bacterium]